MRHDNRTRNAAQRSLAVGHTNPCVCTADPDWVDDTAAGNRFTELTFEEVVAEGKPVGAKIGNNGNLATEHGELLATANFGFYIRGE